MSMTKDPFSFLNGFAPFPGDQLESWTGINFIWGGRGYWTNYEQLVVLGALMAFAMAWAIGANDVANSFGTSVGAKTLTLWQACVIAAIFEFTGAIVLGGQVAKTVAGSITSPSYFQAVPEVFAFGMLCALSTAALIVTIATYFECAVSTTHSIIGAVLGFGMVFGGSNAIVWNEPIDEFPYRKGVVTIFISWFVSPTLSAILGGLIFFLNRLIILRRKNSTEWAFWSLPILALITVFINVFFVLFKGAGKELKWDAKGEQAAWVSACVSVGVALLMIPVVLWLRKRHARTMQEQQDMQVNIDSEQGNKDKAEVELEEPKEVRTGMAGMFDKVKAQAVRGLTMDVHEDIQKDARVAAMHANAEVFNPETEQVYKYLQVFSACCVAFAHGANDVANAIGPFAGIWYVYRTFNVSSNAETPKWILAMGGAGIVVGLATYGYNIIKVLGVAMATMTPSRGYSAELATALTVSIASVYGLPISTTQCIVGAEVGVGCVENINGSGTNWRLFGKTAVAWVLAFSFSALVSGGIFAFCVYAPGLTDLDYVGNWQSAMTNVMAAQITVLNNTNLQQYTALNKNISGLAKNLTSMNTPKTYGKINMYDMMSVFKNVTWLYLNWTIPGTGAVLPLAKSG